MATVATFNSERAQALLDLLLAGKFAEANAQVVSQGVDAYEQGDVLMVLGNECTITPKYGDPIIVDHEFTIEFVESGTIEDGERYMVVDDSCRIFDVHGGRVDVELSYQELRTLAHMHFQCSEAGRIILP